MAVISTEKIYLKESGQWNKVVKYSKGVFSVLLPDIICFDLCITEERDKTLCAGTEEEVNRKFTAVLKEWEASATQTEKVIIFRAKFQGGLIREEYRDKWHGGKYAPAYLRNGYTYDNTTHHFIEQEVEPFSVSLGLVLHWGIYDKSTFKNKSRYKFVSGRYFDSRYLIGELSSGLTEITWSIEREEYFLKLDESFAKMIAAVYVALGDLTPEKLAFLADSGKALLLTDGKSK